nr:hypothetical protein CFP56_12468 [Quercus suber]
MLELSLNGSWCHMKKSYAQLLYSQGWDSSNFLFRRRNLDFATVFALCWLQQFLQTILSCLILFLVQFVFMDFGARLRFKAFVAA